MYDGIWHFSNEVDYDHLGLHVVIDRDDVCDRKAALDLVAELLVGIAAASGCAQLAWEDATNLSKGLKDFSWSATSPSSAS